MRRVPQTPAPRRQRPEVTVVRRCRRPGAAVNEVRGDAVLILAAMGEAESELTVSLVGDAEIHELNRRYRRKDRPTDVLAFAMREGEAVAGEPGLLGDVVISLDTAARQARARRRTLAAEVRILLVHGILHLLGYDHERGVAAARRMRATERRLLTRLRRGANVDGGQPS